MQPKLSLNYNSQGGNGLLGMGWSIGGLSVIHHCGATITVDEFKGGVNYSPNDKYCLDGERLIWDATMGFYRTQHESWQKIVFSGFAHDPTSFTVTSKDGTVRYYGATADSRIEAAPFEYDPLDEYPNFATRLWALNRIQDLNGNYITITYGENNANGEFWPSSVAYTGNVNTGTPAYNTVYFDYLDRSDITTHYEGGSVININQRLWKIRVNAGTSQVREYRFLYDFNEVVRQSRLTSVQECGSDGVCLPRTNFTWTPVASALVGASVNTGIAANPRNGVVRSADINGDGRNDLVWADASSQYIYTVLAQSSTSGFAPPPARNSGLVTPTDFSMGDINGDGRSDLAKGPANSVYYALSTSAGLGSSWSGNIAMCSTSSPPCDGSVLLADRDGDGRADALLPTGNKIYTAISNGTNFGPVSSSYHGNLDTTSIALGEFNGDGRSDLFYVQWAYNRLFAYDLSLGAGYYPGFYTSNNAHNLSTGPWPADINGDGKSDLIWIENNSIHYAFATGGIEVYSTGAGFTPEVDSFIYVFPVAGSNVTPADINGDGQADVVWMRDFGGITYIFYSLATGNGFAPAVNSYVSAPISAGPWAVDFNGDEKHDLVWLYNGTIYSSLAQGGPNDLLISATDGLGVTTNVTYKPLTDSTVHTKDSSAVYPYQDIQNATYVVSQSSQSNGLGGVNTTSYQYGGLKAHYTAAAGLGFRWMKVTDPAGLIHITYFNQTLNGTEGTVASSETWAGNVRVKYAGNTWTPVALGGGRTLARLASTVEQTRELDNSIVTTVDTSYSGYDSYGNAGSIVTNYAAAGVSDGWSKITNNTYNNDTVNWQLGQLLQSQVTAYAPGQTALTRTSSFTYDALGRLATEVIEPNSATLRLTTTYGYDPIFGNRTTKTVSGPGITTRTVETLTYDTRGQFVETRQNALNHPESYTYDVRTGAVTTITDANNIKTTYTYNDGFGRKTGESRPGSPTTTIYYTCLNNTVPASGVPCPAPAGSGCARFAPPRARPMSIATYSAAR